MKAGSGTAPVSRVRRLIVIVALAALVVGQAVAVVTVTGPAPAASAAAGNPGTPSPGTVIFSDGFGSPTAAAPATLITSYVGTGGQRYTADPAWASFPNCNGFVVNRLSPRVTNECSTSQSAADAQVGSAQVRNLVIALGQFEGQGASNLNAAVTSYTAGDPGPGIVLKTAQPISVGSAGRFLTFSVVSAVQNCASEGAGRNDPQYSLFLLNGTTKLPINSTPLNPCTNPRYTPFTAFVAHVGTITGPQPILWTASTVGFEFDNAQGSGAGNDAAFDNVQLMDVTPQLDKAFSPNTIVTGGVSRLTFTVTNTDDLFVKPNWSFTDTLPTGVAVASNPDPTTTCLNTAITATAGSGSIVVPTGTIDAGQTSCTIGVNVTAPTRGAYTNAASNVTSSGLLPPGATTLTVVDTDFGDAPASYGTAGASHTATSGLSIGAKRDAELAAAPSADASGDDTTGVDDEDGLSGTTSLRANQSMTVAVPVVNSTGAAATLAGWIDFNRDGDFDDPGERTTVAVAAGATSVNLAWPAQTAASGGASFIRLRLMPGSVAAPSPTAAITGGEIEDHPVTLVKPAISLVKRAGSVVERSAPTGPSTGDTVAYTFDVTNTGDQPLTAIAVVDPKVTGISCPAGTLAVNATVTCTAAAHALTQAEVDAGTIHNTATVSGTPPTGPAVTATSSADVSFTTVASLTLDKTAQGITDANGNGRVDPGDTIRYGFSILNTGTVTISLKGVTDPKVGPVLCPSTTLLPGRTAVCGRPTYTLTQDDVEAGAVNNTATAAALAPDGTQISGSDSTSTPITRTPRISLVKSASAVSDLDGNGTGAGDQVTYGFVATNTGNVSLTSVAVSDPKVGPVTCPSTALAPGASVSCTANSYTLTQADIDSGGVNNTAVAQGTSLAGTQVTGSSSTSTPAAAAPVIRLAKTAGAVADANGDGVTDAGDRITYSFAVSNRGNVTLNPITVTDAKVGAVTCPAGALAPGATVTCTATPYTLTASDLDSGAVNNTATASGKPPTGANVTGTSSASTPVAGVARVTLAKTAGAPTDVNGNGVVDRGDSIRYSFRVTNSGTVTLNPITVSDPKAGAVTCPAGALLAGQSVDCTAAPYVLTQADIDSGGVNNTATATGTAPNGGTTNGASSTSTPLAASPAMRFQKSASAIADLDGNGPDVGDQITYEFLVVNSGNVSLNPVAVTDPKIGPVTCPPVPLTPGLSFRCEAEPYTLTQADVDAGSVNNTAEATAAPPGGPALTSASSTSTPVVGVSSIRLVKTAGEVIDANGNGRVDAGDTITYSFAVTNGGATTLATVTVADPKVGPVTCPTGTLAPGATATCAAATFTLRQADVDSGAVNNTATATATSPSGGPVSDSDSTSTPVVSDPAIELVKSADPLVDANGDGAQGAGDTITYSFAVTNLGNVTLDSVTVRDPKVGAVTCPSGALPPGASITCTAAPYALTQNDADSGAVNNTATATGTPPIGAAVTDDASTVTRTRVTSSIDLVKTAKPNSASSAGTVITYTFAGTNVGQSTLTNVAIADPLPGLSNLSCSPAQPVVSMAPGGTVSCTATRSLTQADVDAGGVTNTATITGTTPGGATVSDVNAALVTVLPAPSIELVKTAGAVTDANGDGRNSAGDTIAYSFAVTNSGNVTLDKATVSDAKVGAVTCPPGSLAPGAAITCSAAPYVLTQADVDAGAVNNSATATGTPPTGEPVSGPSSTSTPVATTSSLTITTTPSQTTATSAGTVITYTYVGTNTGPTTLSNVSITDPLPGLSALTCSPAQPATLAPGASITCTASRALTQADVDAGRVANTGTARGTPPSGAPVSAADPAEVTIVAAPAIGLIKRAGAVIDANGDGAQGAGDTITYSFAVENAGNVTLDPISVTDPKVGAVTCPTGPVAPSAAVTCTAAPYRLTQADVDSGAVNNTATASGVDPTGAGVTAQSSTSSTIVGAPSVGLVKSAGAVTDANASGRTDAGDTIAYSFVVTNSGTVTLNPVTVADPKVGVVTCPTGPLAPSAAATCTAAPYVLTQTDADSGAANNTATATGVDPRGASATARSSTSTPIEALPSIGLVKTAGALVDADGSGGQNAGDTITYGFVVTNSGTVTLDPVTVTDAKVGAVTCPAGPLAPAASVTCTAAAYVVTQSDVDSGAINNTAIASGVDPTGAATTGQSSTSTPITGSTSMRLVKSAAAVADANGSGREDAGDTITYSFAVTNTGGVTLDGVTVADDKVGAVTCPAGALTPNSTVNCIAAPYVLTQADADAGTVQNSATATGEDPTGAPVSAVDTVDTPVRAPSSLALAKHAAVSDVDDDGKTDLGDTIRWTLDVTNTGATTLTNVSVSDPTAGDVTCPSGDLAPGATIVYTTPATHTITQAEADAGAADNTATATAADPRQDPVVSPPSSTRTPVVFLTGMAMQKHAELADTNHNGAADIGEHIHYTFVVTNTGSTTLEDVGVNDPKLASADLAVNCPAAPLAPDASVTCVAQDWIVTAADVAKGDLIRNVATAHARPLGQLATLASAPSVADVSTPKPTALAFTGANAAPAAGIMLGLLVIGLALILVGRRRRRNRR